MDDSLELADVHTRRLASDYAEAWAALLPTGPAWPRDPSSVLQTVILGLCGIWGAAAPGAPGSTNVDGRAADLLETESDPRSTVELLPDWEKAFGLPDLCLAEPLTIGDRQKALTVRVAMLGGQSRQWFIDLAASIGYEIVIGEHSPFTCGLSECGDTRFLPDGSSTNFYRWEIGLNPSDRFYFTVSIVNTRLTWFRAGGGGGEVGVDPSLRIAIATDLECLINRYHPGHTDVQWDYSGLQPYDAMEGTP